MVRTVAARHRSRTDPSFNRQLIKPAIGAFGGRRVQLALLTYLGTGSPADIAGAARAWYWTRVLPWHPPSHDLQERYIHTALNRFVAEDDLDVRRCILPGLPLNTASYPAEVHELVAGAVRIARESDDDYLRHRVEIQVRSGR